MCILLSGKQGDNKDGLLCTFSFSGKQGCNKDRLLCAFCCQVNKEITRSVSCVHFVVR